MDRKLKTAKNLWERGILLQADRIYNVASDATVGVAPAVQALRGNILIQCTTKDDINQLHATADPQKFIHPDCLSCRGKIGAVCFQIKASAFRMRPFLIKNQIHIHSARQQHAVAQAKILPDFFLFTHQREHEGKPASPEHCIYII